MSCVRSAAVQRPAEEAPLFINTYPRGRGANVQHHRLPKVRGASDAAGNSPTEDSPAAVVPRGVVVAGETRSVDHDLQIGDRQKRGGEGGGGRQAIAIVFLVGALSLDKQNNRTRGRRAGESRVRGGVEQSRER